MVIGLSGVQVVSNYTSDNNKKSLTNLYLAPPKERNLQRLRVQVTGIQQLRWYRFSFSLTFVQETRHQLDCIRTYPRCSVRPTGIVQQSLGINL